MRLVSITLKNIRSYTHQTINFPEGTVLLSGDIGAGKSTLLLAIEFALFGVKRGLLSGEGLLRHGANEGSVEFTFQIDNKDIIIFRSLRRVAKTIRQEAGYLIADGVRHDCTATELKIKVFDLLGYPAQFVSQGEEWVYRYTVYTPQEEMKTILFTNPQERLNILRRVLGIDKYKRIRENAQLQNKELRQNIRVLEEVLKEKEVLQVSLLRSEEELATAKRKHEQAMQAHVEKEAFFSKLAAQKEQTSQEHTRLLQLQEKNHALSGRIHEHAEKFKQLKEKASLKKEEVEKKKVQLTQYTTLPPAKDIKPLQDQIIEERKIHSQVQERFTDITTRHDTTLRQIQLLNKDCVALLERKKELDDLQVQVQASVHTDLSALEQMHKQHTEELHGLRSTRKEKQGQITQMHETIHSVDSIKQCPTCLQEVGTDHKHIIRTDASKKIDDHKTIVDSLQTREELLTKELLMMEKDLETSRGLFNAQMILKGKIQAESRVITDLKKKQEEVATQQLVLETIRRSLNEIQDPKQLFSSIQAKEKELDTLFQLQKQHQQKLLLEQEIHMLESQYQETITLCKEHKQSHERLTQEKKDLQFSDEQFSATKISLETITKEHQGLHRQLQQLQGDLSSAKTQSEMLSIELEKSRTKMQQFLSKEQELTRSRTLSHWLSGCFVPLMDIMERHVLTKINLEFNEFFRTWFSLLVDNADMHVQVNDEFSPTVIQDGYPMDVEYLSGGEKTAVALAYRLALHRVINTLVETIATKDLIILDEPTDGFSSQQLDRVKEVLEQLHTTQTIIVSHDPKVESFVQSIIHIKKTEHESVVE